MCTPIRILHLIMLVAALILASNVFPARSLEMAAGAAGQSRKRERSSVLSEAQLAERRRATEIRVCIRTCMNRVIADCLQSCDELLDPVVKYTCKRSYCPDLSVQCARLCRWTSTCPAPFDAHLPLSSRLLIKIYARTCCDSLFYSL